MKPSNVPSELHWMIPVVQLLSDSSEQLGSTEEQLIRKRFDSHLRQVLEEWIDSSNSIESEEFFSAFLVLDEMGLLDQSESELTFDSWMSSLDSPVWGIRRGAIREIGEEYLHDLDATEMSKLISKVETMLQVKCNPNTELWLRWLECLLYPERVEASNQIRACLHFHISQQLGDDVDVAMDAWAALLTIPQVTSSDIESAQQYVFSRDLDETDAAIVLSYLFKSEFVPHLAKKIIIETSLASRSSRLKDLAREAREALRESKND